MSSGHDTRKNSPADIVDTEAGDAADGTVSSNGKSGGRNGKSRAARPTVIGKDRDTGSALRTVYQQTVDEAIPAEMLDLLGKLD